MRSTKAPSMAAKLYVFDLDGVIYRGTESQAHSREIIEHLKSLGHIIRYLTNNSSKTRQTYSAKLSSMGIPATVDEIMTSSYAAALYFAETNAVGKTVYVIGERGITEELTKAGMNIITGGDDPDAHVDFVVAGMDRQFNYQKLARAQDAILHGARFIATNEDATFPVEGGRLMPGAGTITAAIRAATSVEPFVVGKPQLYAFEKILQLTGVPAQRTVVIGDRLTTDVLVGNRAGAETVLVLTGCTSREEADAAEGEMKPHRIIDTLAELV